ncbi:hypothetical protein TNCV_4443971 [Trichonephila clavipes]|nr:hypothetical protein TNCV_4443971 [Trichonephila clavipes]
MDVKSVEAQCPSVSEVTEVGRLLRSGTPSDFTPPFPNTRCLFSQQLPPRLKSLVVSFLERLSAAMFQLDKARPHVYVTFSTSSLSVRLQCCPGLVLLFIERTWWTIDKRLVQYTPPAATSEG